MTSNELAELTIEVQKSHSTQFRILTNGFCSGRKTND